MKINSSYILRVNDNLGTVVWGTKEYDNYITKSDSDIGRFMECKLSDLKFTIRNLENRGYKVYKYNKSAKKILNTFNKRCLYEALKYLSIYG